MFMMHESEIQSGTGFQPVSFRWAVLGHADHGQEHVHVHEHANENDYV